MYTDKDSNLISNRAYDCLTSVIKCKMFAPCYVSPHHQSLQAEHGIKSLSTILTKHLMDLGQMWLKYLPLATLAYNTFNTPNLSTALMS